MADLEYKKVSQLVMYDGDVSDAEINIVVGGESRKTTGSHLAGGSGLSIITIDALRSSTVAVANRVYQVNDPGKEGQFYYDATDTSSADNGGTIIVNGEFRFKRILNGVINSKWFATGDGSTDDLVQLQKAFDVAVAQKQRLNINGVHSLGSGALNIYGANVHILSTGDGELKTSGDRVFNVSGTLSNLIIENLKVTSTGSTGDFYGLFTSDNQNIERALFRNLEMSAPTAITNAFKFINSGDNRTRKISFSNVRIINIGQMAIEFQNHDYDGEYRYEDISLTDVFIENTGLASAVGFGISFSGRGRSVTGTNIHMRGTRGIGLELAGSTKDFTFKNLVIEDCQAGCSPISITNSIATAPGNTWYHENFSLDGCITTSDARNNFYRLKNSTIGANCNFIFTDDAGYVQIKSCLNCTFSPRVLTPGQFAIFVTSDAGIACKENKITEAYLDNSACATNSAVVQFDQVDTNANIVVGCTLKKGTGGAYVADTNSAGSVLANRRYNNVVIDPATGIITVDSILIGDISITRTDPTVLLFGPNNLYANSLRNYNAAGNATMQTADDGVRLSRNIASSVEPAVRSSQSGAGSTGDIHEFRDPAAAKVATVRIDGTIENAANVLAAKAAVPGSPAIAGYKLYSHRYQGDLQILGAIDQNGRVIEYVPWSLHGSFGYVQAITGAFAAMGILAAAANGVSTRSPTNTSLVTQIKRNSCTTGTGANNGAGIHGNALIFWRGNSAGLGGFFIAFKFVPAATTAGTKGFFGVWAASSSGASISTSEPSNMTNFAAFCWDSDDSHVYFKHNDASSTATEIDLGADFPARTDQTDAYEAWIWCWPNDTKIHYWIKNIADHGEGPVETSGEATTNLPANDTFMRYDAWINTGSSGVAVPVDISQVYASLPY